MNVWNAVCLDKIANYFSWFFFYLSKYKMLIEKTNIFQFDKP